MDKITTKVSQMVLASYFLLSTTTMAEPTIPPENDLNTNPTTESEQLNDLDEQAAEAEELLSKVTSVTPYKMHVTDQLFVYLHAGSNNRYRIIGRVEASEQITVSAKDEVSGWLQITLNNGKKGWIDNTMLTKSSGIKGQLSEAQKTIRSLQTRVKQLDNGSDEALVDLQNQLASITEQNQNLTNQNQNLNSKVEQLLAENSELQATIIQVDQTQKILDQLYDVGAVLIGVFAGWFISRRRKGGLNFDRL